ncbi:MAG: glycosyl hydrolase 53 family protein [Lachnospiraceae bacterium]|nr:glycosyl hydrolase 53 family protein [Lachnospiraceae bacterium]
MGRQWRNRCIAAVSICALLGLSGCGNAAGQETASPAESVESPASPAENAGETAASENAAEPEGAQNTETEGPAPKAEWPVDTVLYELPAEAEEADIYVEPIAGLSGDFIRGVDISSVLVEEKSGVVYYNEAGEEQDLFQTLAQNGVNYIRVRVWNDPFDEDGNGYGGGNNDTAAAAEIGARAAKYGMKICVDYHYSDFWADPNKQQCPKAWEDMAIEDKSEALYQFTKESLSEIIDAGAVVGMVQIGNEINNGMSGETDWTKRRQLMQAGSKAVREIAQEAGQDIQIAVHFTDVSDKSGTLGNAQKLLEKEIDYDIFAVSYYPFWHGSLENLTDVLQELSETYGKKVMVAETSYPYTTGDGDGSANSIGESDLIPEYAAGVQGQTNEIRDVCAAVADVGEAGLGVFYWEPAWIPVGVYEEDAADASSVLSANQESWEKNGSGWASSYAAAYDPKDAGVYYGGSSWDNQALFDYEGHPLESLKVFKYLHCGTIVEQAVESILPVEINVPLEAELVMPETVSVVCNDRSTLEIPVLWDAAQTAAIDTSASGTYEVDGSFMTEADFKEDAAPSASVIEFLENEKVIAKVSVNRLNMVANSSFEEEDTSMWVITAGGSGMTDFQNKESDAYSGAMSLHYYSTGEVSFTVEQTITGLVPGTYEFGLYLQGGDAGDNAEMYIYADNGKERLTEDTGVAGWCNWQEPVISDITVGEDGTLTVGASISCAAKGWGTLDDFYLYQVK